MGKNYFKIWKTVIAFIGLLMLFSGKLYAYTAPTALQVLWPGTDQTATCHDYGDYITNVTFAGINNTTAGSGAKAWHSDFGRDPQIAAGEVTIGQSYSFSVTLAGSDYVYDYVAVYVDWNQNNVNGTTGGTIILDTNENPLVWNSLTGSGSKTLTGSITVPTGISTGLIYMRVMIDCDSNNPASGDFTCGIGYGEFQDYVLNVSAASVAPTVTTQAVSSIAATTATGNGNITSLGNPNPTVSGICWNTSSTPTTSNFKTTNGPTGVTGAYTGSLTSLSANTTYYVRAYATNSVGTSYGTEVSFTTLPVAPTVTTQAVSSITTTTATGNGNITVLGVPNPTAYGVCWNTTGTPTTSDSKDDKGAASATGAFTASITGLTAGTIYHVRAFATNTAGTVYGDEEDFTALKVPTVTTQAVSGIGTTTATGNGNITDLGVPNPTAHGVCWNTTGTPTTSDSKDDKGAASATGAFTASITGLTPGTTYHVRAFATNSVNTVYGAEEDFTAFTAGTFTGTTDNNWSTDTNWAGGSVPGSGIDVIIPSGKTAIIGATTQADCNNLTVTGTLTIASSDTGTGSLIIHGTPTGNVTVQRYMTASTWHLISSPVSGQSIASFLDANSLIDAKGDLDQTRAMKNYDEATDTWSALFTNSTSGNMGAANGCAVWTTDGGTVSFSGALQTGTTNIAVTRTPTTGCGWNLVGNPYSSAIAVNTAAGTENFINLNSSNMDVNYCGIYYWNGSAYIPVNLSGGAFYAQLGQGFFVKSKVGGGTISLTPAQQTHQPTAEFKNAVIPWPEIKLMASLGYISNSTVIRFNENMKRGLDPGYDAGIMKSGFDVYTKLVEANGIDFGIQCIPFAENYETIIPVGLESATKGTVTFSAEMNNLPSNYQVVFEDREAGTFIPLILSSSICTMQVAANSKVDGRFFLHVWLETSTLAIKPTFGDWKIYQTQGQIRIEGSVTGNATATLYDILGRKVGDYQLQKGTVNDIPCSDFRNGVYLLNIRQGRQMFTRKIVVNNN